MKGNILLQLGLLLAGAFLAGQWLRRFLVPLPRNYESGARAVALTEFYKQGYVFCTLFTAKDVERCAQQIGVGFLTAQERGLIIMKIKNEFTIQRGISEDVIKDAIRQWRDERRGNYYVSKRDEKR